MQMASLAHADCVPTVFGIKAWWKGESNATEVITGNTGVENGNDYAAGKVGTAMSFDGTSYIEVASAPNMKFTGPFTVEAWINLDSTNGNHTVVAKGIDYDVPVDWAVSVSDGKLRPHVQVDENWYYFDCSGSLSTSTWYHVAMVYDGSALRGYVNGAQQGVTAVSGTVHTSDDPLRIGVYSANDSHAFFDGRIDELSLYSRALSTAELLAIYNAGTAGKCALDCGPELPELLAWWKAQNNANDSAGSHNGTSYGATYDSGRTGQAFEFDGESYVSVPNSSDLEITGPFSIEAWVKYSGEGNKTIIAKGTDYDVPVDWALSINEDRLRPHVQLDSSWHYFDCETPLQPDTWYHVVMVYTGSSLDGYVNGTLDGSVEVSGTVNSSEETLRIGVYSAGDGHAYFSGLIDELSLYSRALSANDIQVLYQAGAAAKCTECYFVYPWQTALWQANNSAADALNTHNGTWTGSSAYANAVNGAGFDFDGSSYVSVNNASALQFTGSFTIDAWVKIDTTSNNMIVSKGASPLDYGLEITSANKLKAHARIGGTSQTLTCNTTLVPGNWYYVAMVYDGSTLRGYVNGVQDGSLTVSGSVGTSSSSLFIGKYFQGTVDDVAVYGRALSPHEILSTFRAGIWSKCHPLT